MRDANARFVFTLPTLLPTVREAAALAGGATVVVLGEAAGALAFASLMACTDPEPAPDIDPDALAALPYSSGTTGMAKGVMLTHATIVANVSRYLQALGTRRTRCCWLSCRCFTSSASPSSRCADWSPAAAW